MKRIIAVICGFVLLFLAAWGSNADNSARPSAVKAQTDSIDPRKPQAPTDLSSGIAPGQAVQETSGVPSVNTASEDHTAVKINVQAGGSTFTATLENNPAAEAFAGMMQNGQVVLSMSDYSGFEKVAPLGTGLPASDSETTAQAGDIVLYNGNQIVLFYGSNSWSYTRLGRIDDLTGWGEALGAGDVTVTFSIG